MALTPPSVAIDTIATGDVLNAVAHGAALPIAGTAAGADGQTVTIGLNGQQYTATVVAGAWSVTVPRLDVSALANLQHYQVTAGVTDVHGNVSATAQRDLGVAITPPSVAIDAIAGDGVLNAVEHGAALTLSGTAAGADGQTVSVGLNGQQ